LQPSIQQLVGKLGSDCLTHLKEEAVHTDAYTQDTSGVKTALLALEAEFSSSAVDPHLLAEALQKAPIRAARRKHMYDQTVGEFVRLTTST
jgi:proteasome activator subunit 4